MKCDFIVGRTKMAKGDSYCGTDGVVIFPCFLKNLIFFYIHLKLFIFYFLINVKFILFILLIFVNDVDVYGVFPSSQNKRSTSFGHVI